MKTDLMSFVLSSNRRKEIVKTIFEYPRRQWSCPHLQDLTKISHATVFRTVNGLRDFGLLKGFRLNRKDMVYELVSESPLAKELKKMLTIEQDIAKKIARDFVNRIKSEKIKSVILYGSVVRGNLKPDSDIDILIALERHNKFRENRIFDVANEISFKTNKTISVMFMDLAEIRREKHSQFLKSVKENMQLMHGKNPF